MNDFSKIVKKLQDSNKTISTMESCTGGYIANLITNIPGASDIFKFGAVTYSNEYKIKMGVSPLEIDKYSVYSSEVARNMALSISLFTSSNYAIGITGKINRSDKNNPYGKDNVVYISIYDKDSNKYYDEVVSLEDNERSKNKEYISSVVINMLDKII